MGGISKRVRIYTLEDLEAHNTSHSCWVSRKGKVYDITNFLKDHPGGYDVILEAAGKDVMQDKMEHEHSDSAYEMLEEYVMGRLGTEATLCAIVSYYSPSGPMKLTRGHGSL
jgi:4-hydroxysphinganine ceramide fatty acyl 2-hydroxylase